MTLAWTAARIVAVVYILGYAFAHLPPASVLDTTPLTIPDVVWDPIEAVLHLGRLLPIATLLALATFTIAIQAGMFFVFLISWVTKHVMGGS